MADPLGATPDDYEIDWGKYPKLAGLFEHRPNANAYTRELQKLLAEARADAVERDRVDNTRGFDRG